MSPASYQLLHPDTTTRLAREACASGDDQAVRTLPAWSLIPSAGRTQASPDVCRESSAEGAD